MAAALLDSFLLFLTLVLVTTVGNALIGSDGPSGMAASWAIALMILLVFALFFGYFAAFEALNGGRTPGKQSLGIRVVMDTGRPVTAAAAVVRNLVRLLDCY